MAGDVTEYEGTGVITVTIATGYATSSEVDIGQFGVFAIESPSEFEAATISFLGAHVSGGAFYSIYDDSSAEVTLAVATTTASMHTLNSLGVKISPYRYIKLVCGDAATPATVATDRTIYILGKSG